MGSLDLISPSQAEDGAVRWSSQTTSSPAAEQSGWPWFEPICEAAACSNDVQAV
jgi:hypothetical protein